MGTHVFPNCLFNFFIKLRIIEVFPIHFSTLIPEVSSVFIIFAFLFFAVVVPKAFVILVSSVSISNA